MNRLRLLALLATLLVLALSACTRLVQWEPVTDGVDLGADHIVH